MESLKRRNLKRKHQEASEEDIGDRIKGKLHHEIKEVHKASKRAKISETQKTLKRLKETKKKDPQDKNTIQFEEELTILKGMDHYVVGNSAFQTKVLKDRALRGNEKVKNSMERELNGFLEPAVSGTTLAKIQSRLLSSKILAQQVTASINSLKFLLDPSLKQRDQKIDLAGSENQNTHSQEASGRPLKIHKGPAASEDLTTKNKSKNQAKEKTDGDPINEDEYSQFRSEIGDGAGWESDSLDENGDGVPDNDDGWESGSIDSGGREEGDIIISDKDGVFTESASESDSENDDLEGANPRKSKVKTAKVTANSNTKSFVSKMESTFLPSLSVGFIRGSDDSDFDEDEGNVADMPKKNRRGQRARRAIWEKKYGRNANHKKKEAVGISDHTSGTSSKSASTGTGPRKSSNKNQGPIRMSRDNSKGKNTPQYHHPVDAGWAGRSESAPAANSSKFSVSKAEKSDKPLHPSWEAKRRLKEKESGGIVMSKGTKIKFS